METPVVVAVVAGSVTAIGWLVNHLLVARREEQRRRTEGQLKFVERQIEELYGPLAFLIYEGKRTFSDLLETLGRRYVFGTHPLPEDELRTWLFWAEAEFLPRNEKIKVLLMAKAHLIEGARFPESYIAFLDHCNSWAIHHRRWKEQQVQYSWHSKINWPPKFETEVVGAFERLKARHAALLGELS
jgi:hypothetical protein